ncbi:MAG: DinB family protein [Gemmatimonadales bacterium]
MTRPTAPEVWLRGAVPRIEPLLQPVAHSLLQGGEEVRYGLADLSPAQLRARPEGAAAVAYHIRHAAGSLDRLFTYARGESLSGEQLARLAAEPRSNDEVVTASELISELDDAVERALTQLRATTGKELLEAREVGRAKLPSTTLGLLFHAAEHTQRHIGQAITTARVARAMVV